MRGAVRASARRRRRPRVSFGGPGLSSSSRFDLAAHPGSVDAYASAGGRHVRTTGIVLVVVGGVAGLTAIGLGSYALGKSLSFGGPERSNAGGAVSAAEIVGAAGGSLLFAGLVTIGAGVTTYDMHDRAPSRAGWRAPAGLHASTSF